VKFLKFASGGAYLFSGFAYWFTYFLYTIVILHVSLCMLILLSSFIISLTSFLSYRWYGGGYCCMATGYWKEKVQAVSRISSYVLCWFSRLFHFLCKYYFYLLYDIGVFTRPWDLFLCRKFICWFIKVSESGITTCHNYKQWKISLSQICTHTYILLPFSIGTWE
jgi:hypothetical protein